MPTALGGETINERLTRLRAELVRVRATIARSETNGGSFNIGGASVTQIAYERALSREREINTQIAQLEARLAGSQAGLAMATAVTRMH